MALEFLQLAPKRQKLEYEQEDPICNLAVTVASNTNNPLQEDDFEVSDQELVQIITETANTMEMTQYRAEGQTTSKSTVMKPVVEKKTSPKMPIFQNCTFSGNVTFNFTNN